MVFSQSWIWVDPLKSYRLTKELNFSIVIFKAYLKEIASISSAINSELKASVVERFNHTLKTHMWKYFTAKNTHVYIDILQDIVHGYNNSYHRGIGRAPSSVSQCGSSVKNIVREIMDET